MIAEGKYGQCRLVIVELVVFDVLHTSFHGFELLTRSS